MTILLLIIGVVIYLIVGSIVYGLFSDNDPDVELRALCVIMWPVVLVFSVVLWLVIAFDVCTNIVAGIAVSSKKRIIKRFRKEE